jgi:hypothetical protein
LPWGRRVSWGLDLPCWLCSVLQLLGAIKGLFEGRSLNCFLHLVWWQLLFWLEAVRIIQVWLQYLREVFGVTEPGLSPSVTLVAILDTRLFVLKQCHFLPLFSCGKIISFLVSTLTEIIICIIPSYSSICLYLLLYFALSLPVL